MADSDSGDRYEFDAPSHVVDMLMLAEQKAEGEDTWFEQQTSDGRLVTPLRTDKSFRNIHDLDLRRAIVAPQIKVDDIPAPIPPPPPPPPPSPTPPANLVSSWGAGSPARTGARSKKTSNPPAPRRVLKRKEASSGPAPPLKKHKKTPEPRKSSSVLRRSKCPQNSRTAPKSQAAASATSNTSNTEPSSSEDQEMERIRTLQNEVALHRKQNEASYKAALAGNPPPKKMVLSATVPQEFHFNTNSRHKASTSSCGAQKEVDFISQLRKPCSPTKALKCSTVPKPFNLYTGKKKEAEGPDAEGPDAEGPDAEGPDAEGPDAYVPMAQQIQQFQNRTPDRYHLRSRKSINKGPSGLKGDKLKLTQSHTPHLMTHRRNRPTVTKSSAELEEEELEKQQKFKIIALELNRKILESAECLKRPPVKESTVPEGFQLQIDKRLHERQTKRPQEAEEKHPSFRAQPLPRKILEGVVGLPDKKVLQPTVPESPAFILKKRVRVEKVEEVKQPSPIKAPPVPHFGLPFLPQLQENHHVEVCPFSFEERDRERRALKEKKLEEKRNEEVPHFKAQPLPAFDAVLLPEKKRLEPTKPEPFKLLLDERGAVKSSRTEQMAKEEQKREEAALFKARPNTVTHKEPFQPKKGLRAPVVVEAFALSTERRAHERQEFERLANDKEALRMLMEEQQRQEVEQREKDDVTKMRNDQVHAAQPIRHYKPVAVKKSDVPLTIPHSPNFSDRFRL
ncbi:targeting protein for Xklp2-like isoform X2 [Gymnodraco acuticeps]|uniref:Targeting protein for Xklp2-like isoform X2 n=1 Tax=Gymnodraco acuticeps TaxID=8218 RepID=A0A6P8UBQ5_GYMAC|nr:targeting protein for Xklp2-like isoform X2 [Gymnodraco acuticeps]